MTPKFRQMAIDQRQIQRAQQRVEKLQGSIGKRLKAPTSALHAPGHLPSDQELLNKVEKDKQKGGEPFACFFEGRQQSDDRYHA